MLRDGPALWQPASIAEPGAAVAVAERPADRCDAAPKRRASRRPSRSRAVPPAPAAESRRSRAGHGAADASRSRCCRLARRSTGRQLRAGGRRLPRLPAVRERAAQTVFGVGHHAGALAGRRRGAGRAGGPARASPSSAPPGQLLDRMLRGARPDARRRRPTPRSAGLHRQHAEVPAAAQPQPGARRTGALRALPGAPDRSCCSRAIILAMGRFAVQCAAAQRASRSAGCAAACTATRACRWSSPTTRPTCCATCPTRRGPGKTCAWLPTPPTRRPPADPTPSDARLQRFLTGRCQPAIVVCRARATRQLAGRRVAA